LNRRLPGRAIRHASDWSAIVLLDARYSRPTSVKMLPAWISSNLRHADTFGALLKDLAAFGKERQKQCASQPSS
jgi:chromosome transmission fidelity protein 1